MGRKTRRMMLGKSSDGSCEKWSSKRAAGFMKITTTWRDGWNLKRLSEYDDTNFQTKIGRHFSDKIVASTRGWWGYRICIQFVSGWAGYRSCQLWENQRSATVISTWNCQPDQFLHWDAFRVNFQQDKLCGKPIMNPNLMGLSRQTRSGMLTYGQ